MSLSLISNAYAQATTAAPAAAATGPLAKFGSFGQFLPIVLIFVIFYFLLIRPQQKQQKALRAMIASAKKGDDIVLAGGVHGKIVEEKDNVISVEVASNVVMKYERSAIQQVKGYVVNKK